MQRGGMQKVADIMAGKKGQMAEVGSSKKDHSWESNQLQADFRQAHRAGKGKGRLSLQGSPWERD